MRALVINPNTSTQVTQMLHAHLREHLPQTFALDSVTARFGGAYIASEAGYAIAAHAVLDAWATSTNEYDRIVIGCFGDPGLEALREISGIPVIGLAEAAMLEAATLGRFAIITGGERWRPILKRRAAAAGVAEKLAAIHILRETGAELLADRARALDLLAAAAQDCVRTQQAEIVLIGGAALAGMGEALAERLPFPVIDNVSAAARALLTPVSAPAADLDQIDYTGLSSELSVRIR
ncbi:aspartate/glutamate racemase family protein [Uliginosibacterium sp. 31-12]|uniref:aspartate/glutamate racemase family protein n=1 Tax=Uliginosibacterium sp. 31-12 TaxID=3062781 RepID=UPI0026E1F3EB|nr:aspartate/glutamate racemase family protein [Uliginosibacterium sp. 31-12]MDO6388381.1 aspartate/glutamate racemase family protein [Uliginosibacterium sp. 31-12]